MEIWRDIPDFEGLYQASNFGRVRSVDRVRAVAASRKAPRGFTVSIKGKVLKGSPLYDGKGKIRSLMLRLRKEGSYHNRSVHDLILSSFVGPRPAGHYGCHKDDRPINNRLANLYWGTPTENSADKIRLGNQPMGQAIPWSKLTEGDVKYIRSNAGKIAQSAMAEQFGVRQSQISRVINRKEWTHV